MSKDEIWNNFLQQIKKKTKISPMTYNYLFSDLKLYSYENNKIIIVIPEKVNKNNLLQTINKFYSNIINEVFDDITNDTCDIEYVFESDLDKLNIKTKSKQTKESTLEIEPIESSVDGYSYSSSFSSKYTFDTFVVGESNKLAYGTALAIAKNPGKLYNPYFLYAKSGLGKTHLLQAIGNYIVTHSDKKVLYITAEDFSNDYRSIINSKGQDNNIGYLEAFREKYRNVDVLMIDDIQYLENKTKSQIEFINTFNALYGKEKQIIIASTISINEYKNLDESLETRLRWGLTESINLPELELKKNIIKNKIKIYYSDLNIDNDIVDYIANNCGNDIRNLENAVTRIAAYKSILHLDEITINDARDALKEIIDVPIYRTNSVAKIISEVAKYYGLDVSMLKGKMKKKNIAEARAVAIYLCRLLTQESLERIGLEIGGRDHSTVIYNYDKIKDELQTNIRLQEEIRIIKDKLNE